jgi:hypothetical protein
MLPLLLSSHEEEGKPLNATNGRNKMKAIAVTMITGAMLNLCLLSGRAQPIIPGFMPSTTPSFIQDTSHSDGGAVDLGMVFTPTINISVNALGFYDISGVTGNEPVAIYDSSGNIVAQTDVTTSDAVTLGYYWASITPVNLQAGQQYTVDSWTGDYGNYYGYNSVPTLDSRINYTSQTYDYTSAGLAFPTATASHAADAYYGPNFSIGPALATPDGGMTMLLLGMSFGALKVIRGKLR